MDTSTARIDNMTETFIASNIPILFYFQAAIII